MEQFNFKQFSINHSKSGHKVGTDGVLLGAWTSLVSNPSSILDIGSGTGLIALIMAQRSYAETIDAIEINPDAYEECAENFENSIWNDRLFCYHGDVNEFAEEPDLQYDLILCNPPFFENDLTETLSNRNQARKQFSLTYKELLKSVKSLLSSSGEFSTVIPYTDHEKFIDIAGEFNLYPYKITHIRGHINSDFKRSLIQFSFEEKPVESDELVLEISRHNYTDDYKNLVNDFYLNL